MKIYEIQSPQKPSRAYRLKNPILFQGWGKKSNYFEGWYYKLVDVKNNIALAVIPGISLNNQDPHAFIQVIDGVQCKSTYHRFPINAFKNSDTAHYVNVDNNIFSEDMMSLNLKEIQCELALSSWTKLSYKWYRPGIMGCYAYIPTMQCYHGLGSMNHNIVGSLKLYDQSYELQSAKGYIEKDWGSSFPKSWIWIQCNSFSGAPDLSVFASIAHIPWMKAHFIGFLGAIYINEKIEIFSTYTGARRKTIITEKQVTIEYQNKSNFLKIEATKAPGADLLSPISGEMRGKVNDDGHSPFWDAVGKKFMYINFHQI